MGVHCRVYSVSDEYEAVLHSDDGVVPVWYLVPKTFRLETKSSAATHCNHGGYSYCLYDFGVKEVPQPVAPAKANESKEEEKDEMTTPKNEDPFVPRFLPPRIKGSANTKEEIFFKTEYGQATCLRGEFSPHSFPRH